MPADNRAALAAATRQRSEDTRARARDAIRRLDREGAAITFTTVATTADVSRSLLYRDPALRAEIERLRPSRATADHRRRPAAAERATDTSLKQRLATALDDNRDLRADNAKLRAHVAALLGEQRAVNSSKPRARPIGPCS